MGLIITYLIVALHCSTRSCQFLLHERITSFDPMLFSYQNLSLPTDNFTYQLLDAWEEVFSIRDAILDMVTFQSKRLVQPA